MPGVSVLMPVRNVESFIGEAIQSILAQTYNDFEFLIADDASTDKTWPYLQFIAQRDSRIKLYKNETNLGIADTLNFLIDEAQGEYIARMDGDDLSVNERFEWQVRAFDDTNVDLCAGWMTNCKGGKEEVMITPTRHDEICLRLLFENVISHPTVMVKRKLLEVERYRTGTVPAEDYDLWVRLARIAKFHILPKVVLVRRVHSGGTSVLAKDLQEEVAGEISTRALLNVGVCATPEQARIHSRIRKRKTPEDISELKITERWMLFLYEKVSHYHDAEEVISTQWYRYILKSAHLGLTAFKVFRDSKFREIKRYRPWTYIVVFILCFFRVRYASLFYRMLFSLGPTAALSRRYRLAAHHYSSSK